MVSITSRPKTDWQQIKFKFPFTIMVNSQRYIDRSCTCIENYNVKVNVHCKESRSHNEEDKFKVGTKRKYETNKRE